MASPNSRDLPTHNQIPWKEKHLESLLKASSINNKRFRLDALCSDGKEEWRGWRAPSSGSGNDLPSQHCLSRSPLPDLPTVVFLWGGSLRAEIVRKPLSPQPEVAEFKQTPREGSPSHRNFLSWLKCSPQRVLLHLEDMVFKYKLLLDQHTFSSENSSIVWECLHSHFTPCAVPCLSCALSHQIWTFEVGTSCFVLYVRKQCLREIKKLDKVPQLIAGEAGHSGVFCLFVCLFLFFRAAPAAYGNSQVRVKLEL